MDERVKALYTIARKRYGEIIKEAYQVVQIYQPVEGMYGIDYISKQNGRRAAIEFPVSSIIEINVTLLGE